MAANRPPDSPYLAARQEWTERYGSYVQAARAWRIVGILGLSMAVIGFTYAMYLSTQVKLVPYIVEVDKLGTSVTAGFPQQIEYADARVVRATLGNFITSLKSITPAEAFGTSSDFVCRPARPWGLWSARGTTDLVALSDSGTIGITQVTTIANGQSISG